MPTSHLLPRLTMTLGIDETRGGPVIIAVARDESAEATAALLHAAREADFQHASLVVLHVPDTRDPAGPDRESLREDTRRLLTDAGYSHLDWDVHLAADGLERADALVQLTEQLSADLLVVGCRRRTPIGKFLLGSTVQRVVLDAPVPVLVVKAPVSGIGSSRRAAAPVPAGA